MGASQDNDISRYRSCWKYQTEVFGEMLYIERDRRNEVIIEILNYSNYPRNLVSMTCPELEKL